MEKHFCLCPFRNNQNNQVRDGADACKVLYFSFLINAMYLGVESRASNVFISSYSHCQSVISLIRLHHIQDKSKSRWNMFNNSMQLYMFILYIFIYSWNIHACNVQYVLIMIQMFNICWWHGYDMSSTNFFFFNISLSLSLSFPCHLIFNRPTAIVCCWCTIHELKNRFWYPLFSLDALRTSWMTADRPKIVFPFNPHWIEIGIIHISFSSIYWLISLH